MAKDPAILWYWGDWFSGTSTLTRHQKGCYMDLLHAQFNNGKLSLVEIKTVLGADFGLAWPALQKKFMEENGLFFNPRLLKEKEKREAFTKSRRDNLDGKPPKIPHMELHMEDENEDAIKISVFIKIGKEKILCTPSFWILRNKETAIQQYMVKNHGGILLTEVLGQFDSDYPNYDFDDHNHVFNSFKTCHKNLLKAKKTTYGSKFEQQRASTEATGAKFREDYIRISNLDEQQPEAERDNPA